MKSLIIGVVSVGASLLLVCCQRDMTKDHISVNEIKDIKQRALVREVKEYLPEGAITWYDSAGIWHNRGMAYVISKKIAAKDSSLDATIRYSAEFGASYLGRKVDTGKIRMLIESFDDLNGERIKKLVDAIPASSEVKNHLHNLFYVLQDTTWYDGSASWDVLRKRIGTIELAMLNASVDEKSKRSMLYAASIARYSSYFWISEYNERHDSPPMAALPFRPFMKNLLKVIHDTGAFVAYGFGGGRDAIDCVVDAISSSESEIEFWNSWVPGNYTWTPPK